MGGLLKQACAHGTGFLKAESSLKLLFDQQISKTPQTSIRAQKMHRQVWRKGDCVCVENIVNKMIIITIINAQFG